jgi:hypothetical protein
MYRDRRELHIETERERELQKERDEKGVTDERER